MLSHVCTIWREHRAGRLSVRQCVSRSYSVLSQHSADADDVAWELATTLHLYFCDLHDMRKFEARVRT